VMTDAASLVSYLAPLEKCLSLIDRSTGREAPELQATCRIFDDGTYWYITNNSRSCGFSVEILVPDTRELFIYDPLDDSCKPLPSVTVPGGRRASLEFEAAGSLLILAKEPVFTGSSPAGGTELLDPAGTWTMKLEDPNVLTLDRCRYSIDGGVWEDEIDVIHLFKKLLDRRSSCRLAMEFRFESRIGRENLTELNLVAEMAEEFDITVNGRKIACDGSDWWKDSSFKKAVILDCLEKGTNRIVLERDFYQSDEVYRILYGENVYETEKNKMTFDVELENIYLTGDFAVKSASGFDPGGNGSRFTGGPFYLASLEEKVRPSRLEEQGLLFFAGKVRLEKSILHSGKPDTRYLLKLNRPDVSMITVLVNGKECANLLWAPWEADLTDFLIDGENTITLILYGSNRNMLGPHHHIDGEPFNVGPGSFTGEWSWVEKQSEAIPATEADKKRNYWDTRYAFVPFGLGEI